MAQRGKSPKFAGKMWSNWREPSVCREEDFEAAAGLVAGVRTGHRDRATLNPQLFRKVPIINRIAYGGMEEVRILAIPRAWLTVMSWCRLVTFLPLQCSSKGILWPLNTCLAILVVFKQLDPATDKIVEGRDYAVQLDGGGDGKSTFKRIFYDKSNKRRYLVARPINPKTKPQRFKIDIEQVIRLGIAMMTISRT